MSGGLSTLYDGVIYSSRDLRNRHIAWCWLLHDCPDLRDAILRWIDEGRASLERRFVAAIGDVMSADEATEALSATLVGFVSRRAERHYDLDG